MKASAPTKVAVVGLGYVGSCVAGTLADGGWDVVGIDLDAGLIGELADGVCRFKEDELAELLGRVVRRGTLRGTTDYAAVGGADVVLITVGTPVRDDGSLADEQLRTACAELGRHLRPGQLVILKSTVPPGVTRSLVLPLLERSGLKGGEDFALAFTPERLAEGTALRELRSFPIVVGGLDEASTTAAADFWTAALGVRVARQDSLEAAEIVKLADNWWIDLNIALANELAKFCALFGVDVLDVIEAANGIPKGVGNVNILLPSAGVGGSCLTKDPWMVWQTARSHGVEILTAPAGRRVNEQMPRYTAHAILAELAALGREPARATVAVLGMAFKNNTGDLRSTPVTAVVEALSAAGVRVRVHDPLVDPVEARKLLGFGLSATVHDAVRGADCVAVLALHQVFESLDYATLPVAVPCLVLDGRAYYSKEKISSLRRLGYLYRGIGR
ncbi:nucleotide sugar dehydrogenase [Streptomyces sp. NPDC050560]|uniref:nucleotide sugar dehydrogenase n=1 Tax=Streptomyces sp. NPDC050560 TaxID=3365630 RepID=UPI0037A16493